MDESRRRLSRNRKASGPVIVRRLRADEWDAYRDLRLKALASDPLAFGSTLAREQEFPESVWRDRARGGADGEERSTWVAVSTEGALVGLVGALEEDGRFVIVSMWLEPAHRGQGVGGRMLDAVLTWIRASHPDSPVELEVNPRLEAAVRLYESRGFRFTGTSEPLGHTPGEITRWMVRSPAEARPAASSDR
jgi:ribosomal protein S18 acetylase RimI-like enzyme